MAPGLIIKTKRKRSKLLCNFYVTRGENAGKHCPETAMIGFTKCKKHFKKAPYQAKLIKKIENIIGPMLEFTVKRNEFGEWEHFDTGFLFDYDTQKIIGKRDSKRELVNLNIYDFDIALRNGWEISDKDQE